MHSVRVMAGATYLRAMHSLSWLGERLGWEWLVYNPLVHYSFVRAARRNAPPLVRAVRELFPGARTLVDVGCGPGIFAAEFQRNGFAVVACEYSARLRAKAAAQGVSVHAFDLSKDTQLPPDVPRDLAICLEVAEHLPPSLAEPLVRYVADCGRQVIFTAAHPGQGGTGHVNEQPKSYWIEKFRAIGLTNQDEPASLLAARLKNAGTLPFMYENMMVFARG